MSYLEYYGLKREPFSNAPVSQFYFNSTPHAQALQRLVYAVQNTKGLALLVGGIGAGKSTLARRLLDSLPEEEYEAALLVIIHSGLSAGWLLKRIALQLGVDKPADEKLTLLGQVYQRLLAIHESGRKAVVLIDEAQMLQTREIMEEFRGLLNLELPEQKLLTFVLFGLPEIEQYVKLDPPLAQRVALRIRLDPLSPESTESYIKHRLKTAGATRMPFSAEAVRAIHRHTAGTPRVINTLCDNCLFEGFLAKMAVVNEALVSRCAVDLGLSQEEAAAPAPVVVAETVPATQAPPPRPAPPAPAAAPRPMTQAPPARPATQAPPSPRPLGTTAPLARPPAAPSIAPARPPAVATRPPAPRPAPRQAGEKPAGVDLGDLDRFLSGGAGKA